MPGFDANLPASALAPGIDPVAGRPSLGGTPKPGNASISIADSTGRLPRDLISGLDRDLRRVVDHLGVGGECRVRIAGDSEVAAAHLRHLSQPGTTDVITFDLSDTSVAGAHLFLDADLLVCLDEAERQARIGRVPVERELLLYIVHGMLHCLGHDDHDESDARAMHALEDQILTAIGVGPVYRRAGGHHGGAPA